MSSTKTLVDPQTLDLARMVPSGEKHPLCAVNLGRVVFPSWEHEREA